LLQRFRIVRALGGIKDFNADNPTFMIAIEHNVVGDFLAVFDRAIGQIKINRSAA
jgi:hypothetical protein